MTSILQAAYNELALTNSRLRIENERLQGELDKATTALRQIAGKNNLEGVAPEDAPSAAYSALHECEEIARGILEDK